MPTDGRATKIRSYRIKTVIALSLITRLFNYAINKNVVFCLSSIAEIASYDV